MFTGDRSVLFQRLMRLFHEGFTGTKHDLADRVFSTYRNIESYIWVLKDLGLVRIVDWRIRKGVGAQKMAVYGFGGGPDAPMPRKKAGVVFDVEYSEVADETLKLLADKPMTAKELSLLTGVGREGARHRLSVMHKAGVIHISGWRRDGAHPPAKIFSAGKGRDAPKPTKVDNMTAIRNRQRKLTERYGEDNARKIMTSRADGGPDRIVIDGKVVYARGKPRGGRRATA